MQILLGLSNYYNNPDLINYSQMIMFYFKRVDLIFDQ